MLRASRAGVFHDFHQPSVLVTRSEKRSTKQISPDTHTISQDPYTPRNPLEPLGHTKDNLQGTEHEYAKSGYILLLAHYIPSLFKFHNGKMELKFIKKLLKAYHSLEHQEEAEIVIAGLT